MMNVPNYQQTTTPMPVYPQYAYPQPQGQQAYQQQAPAQAYHMTQTPYPQYQQPLQPQQTPMAQPQSLVSPTQQIDKSMTEAVLRSDVVAEYAAIVNLSEHAVNLAKEIETTQDPNKKARLKTLFNNVNLLIAQRENRANTLDAQANTYM